MKSERSYIAVLVVDGIDEERERISRALSDAGYAVTVAASGREGLDRVLDMVPEPSLIVLDVDEARGAELLGVMRSYRRLAQIPVIAIVDHEQPTPAGASALLVRPIEAPSLLRAVRRLLERRAANRYASGEGTGDEGR